MTWVRANRAGSIVIRKRGKNAEPAPNKPKLKTLELVARLKAGRFSSREEACKTLGVTMQTLSRLYNKLKSERCEL